MSHERESGRPWDASYQDGPAPWDIGQPQPAIVRIASGGGFRGSVLDAGCGTGEHALLLASLGLLVLGIDVAPTAIAIARAKTTQRGICNAEFVCTDALSLHSLGREFESVVDCGLFHTFDADERPRYVASLASVTRSGARLHILCFSDEGPEEVPHPISRDALNSAFGVGTGWKILSIVRERLQTRIHNDGAPAWLATAERA